MITVSQAEKLIHDNACASKTMTVPLDKAPGRVLRENIYADRHQPPFDRSTMDGIAVSSSAVKKGIRKFRVAGIQPAGVAGQKLPARNSCFEIMTGGVVPQGADTVIPVEQIKVAGGYTYLNPSVKFASGQNINPAGQDYHKGKLLLTTATRMSAAHVAVAASVGKARIKVNALPKIAVIGTGDELVEIDRPVKIFQTRRSNAYTLQALLQLNGWKDVERFHFPDNRMKLKKGLSRILSQFDVLVLSGGVSMGKFDFIPAVLKELGVKNIFHKIAQKPGKPMWLGRSRNGKLIFALPGNPVSTQVCARRYVLPYLDLAAGLPAERKDWAVLRRAVSPHPVFTSFLPVTVECSTTSKLTTTPVEIHGSGDFAALSASQGFVELPPGKISFPAGKIVRLFRWEK